MVSLPAAWALRLIASGLPATAAASPAEPARNLRRESRLVSVVVVGVAIINLCLQKDCPLLSSSHLPLLTRRLYPTRAYAARQLGCFSVLGERQMGSYVP
jgi:hypothetical protein